MSKTITIRLSDEQYEQVAYLAKEERRPISNFITHMVFNTIADMFTVDDQEMKEILSDKELMQRMQRGQQQILEGKYKIVG